MSYTLHLQILISAICLLFCKPSCATPNNGRLDLQLPFVPVKTPPLSKEHNFTLRHIYHKGSHRYPRLFRKIDIYHDPLVQDGTKESCCDGEATSTAFAVKSNALEIQRLSDRSRHSIDGLLEVGEFLGEPVSLASDAWTIDRISGPDVGDKSTVLSFAHIAANAYVDPPHGGEWTDIGGGFNYTEDFGWERDGLRGHVFADTENKTVIIGLKGTSLPYFDDGETSNNDILNDNLFGSCCCGQGGQYAWRRVCDCQTSTNTCNSSCLMTSLRKKSNYYHAARHLYHNITAIYPDADVWLTGHSLGGVVSSLLGLTYGLPTITFEAFPDALAARRLGLPTPPGYSIGDVEKHYTGIYHFGHTADPVYMGHCNSFNSPCTIAGYAFQSKCHTGHNCTYDTVGDLGWRESIGTHRISSVIKDVIEKYNATPRCEQDVDCADCSGWKFLDDGGNGTRTTTTSRIKSSTSQITTTICQTPGWWGCRDGTTSTTTS
ncbi:alpha/beta-hydrolase [Aureobasidium pullulans]|nr:alpha/beta-hydrolase [Aureobasidium pullulans]